MLILYFTVFVLYYNYVYWYYYHVVIILSLRFYQLCLRISDFCRQNSMFFRKYPNSCGDNKKRVQDQSPAPFYNALR